jgi:energy-coupling factor transporter ATP-binding protein EcfA2
MGANGSGKSTLALVLAGVLKPSSGHMRLSDSDEPMTTAPGIVFQNPENQMVASLVEKELAFGLENQAVSQTEMQAEIEKSAALFALQSLLRSTTNRLSGGEQQRVALASVMITLPNLLILDEPDAFLDAESRAMLSEALKGIRSRHPELIEVRVTQDLDVARSFSRLIMLENGEIVADKPPEKILGDTVLLRRCRVVVDEASVAPVGQIAPDIARTEPGKIQPDKIVVRGLEFGYALNRLVLHDLSFSLSRGEVLGVTGPTGSGKTSLGLLLTGILEPQSGAITWLREEKSLSGGPYATMALQQPERQFFLPTCVQEIAFGPENNGTALHESQIDSLLELVGLPPVDFRDRDPFTLSVGEQRRLACAVVLGLHKPFIVFDEPTAGLDADGVARFVTLVRQIRASCGLVVISHDHELLAAISDRILTLGRDGRGQISS